MQLGFGLTFPDLYEREGLIRLDRAFVAFLGETDRALADRLASARKDPLHGKAESELLIALAPHVEDFIGRLFGIETEALALAARHNELAPLYSIKRQFVQRRSLHKVKPEELAGYAPQKAWGAAQCARQFTAWLKDEASHEREFAEAPRYAAWSVT